MKNNKYKLIAVITNEGNSGNYFYNFLIIKIKNKIKKIPVQNVLILEILIIPRYGRNSKKPQSNKEHTKI